MTNSNRSKTSKKVTIQSQHDEEEDSAMEDIPLSQQSMTSSDAGIMAAVAQQMQATKEKKKKEKTKKFIQSMEKELDKCFIKKKDSFAESIRAAEALYETFATSYAVAEDDIRKTWILIREEQKALLDLAVRQHSAATAQSLEAEKSQLSGMASVKRGCEDFKALINDLTIQM